METLFLIDAREDRMVSLQGNTDPILSKSIHVCKQTSISVRLSSRSHEKSLPYYWYKVTPPNHMPPSDIHTKLSNIP